MTTRTELIARLHEESKFDIHHETKEALKLAADMLEADGELRADRDAHETAFHNSQDELKKLYYEIETLREAARLALEALRLCRYRSLADKVADPAIATLEGVLK